MDAERGTTTVDLTRRNGIAAVGQAQERASAEGPELTVVIPTLNERDNIGPLIELLDTVLDLAQQSPLTTRRSRPDAD